MPTPAELLAALKLSPISLDQFVKPLIASDLRIYSQEEYHAVFSTTGCSPVTRQPLLPAPFPFAFTKLDKLCSGPNTIAALLDLATCPVTHKIMLNPRIAHLVFVDLMGDRYPFVLACDESALACLPPEFERVMKINWDELSAVTNQPGIKARLDQEAPAAPAARTPTAMWEAAYLQSRIDFPTAVRLGPAAAPPAAYQGAQVQPAPAAPARVQAPVLPPQAQDGAAVARARAAAAAAHRRYLADLDAQSPSSGG